MTLVLYCDARVLVRPPDDHAVLRHVEHLPVGRHGDRGVDADGTGHVADVLNHLALPFFVLTVSYLAEYSLIMRSSLMEVLGDDFILVARAKGVRERMVRKRHAVPNALLPVMTVTILSLGYVLGGAIVIETIFSWPGLGRLTYTGDRQPGLRAAPGVVPVVQRSRDRCQPHRRPPVLLPRPACEGGLTWRRARTRPRTRLRRPRSTRRRSRGSGARTRSAASGSSTAEAGWGWPAWRILVFFVIIAVFAPLLADKCDLSPICHPDNPALAAAELAVLVRDRRPRAFRALADDLGIARLADRRIWLPRSSPW